jgi:hypothetical protein
MGHGAVLNGRAGPIVAPGRCRLGPAGAATAAHILIATI